MKIPLKRKYSTLSLDRFLLVSFAAIHLLACGPTRHLEDDQRLLKKIKIKYEKESKFEEDLYSLSKQKPNRKLLGLFKIKLGIYNLYHNKENSKIRDNIGEPPVIYDSLLHSESTDLMNRYLNNRGYYENHVDFEAKIKKKNAVVKYQIDKNERYMISKLDRQIPIERMREIYQEGINKSAVEVGKPFDLESMKEERVRIENQMKNVGYYDFSREFVIFKADTSKREKTAELSMIIKNKEVEVGADSLAELEHEVYTISKVYVRMDFDERVARSGQSDTTYLNDLIFTEIGEKKFKYRALSHSIFIRPGQLFKLKDQEDTYRQLSSLGVFSYVSIKYEYDYSTEASDLLVFIDLNPRKQKAYTLLTEGTNNGGNLGINADISIQNRNTFKGAELLQLRFSGGIEAQQLLTNQNDERVTDLLPFNTIEFGPEVSLRVPRFLLPVDMDKFSPRGRPSTTFSVSYNFQRRPDFSRNITNTYMSYSWNESTTKTHIVTPFDFSFIKLDRSSEFDQVLNVISNPFLRNSYTDNLIWASSYSFILNTQLDDKLRNEFYFRGNIEPAGNVLSLLSNGPNFETNEDGSKNVAGIRYAQYIKGDIDFRFYQRFRFENKLVYRFTFGIGQPYGNSVALPFEKSFFAGGANGIRAWLARDLGPGTLLESAESNVDQIGNLSLQGNLEYRFPITGVFEGAAFADFGNIWNYKIEDAPEETEFNTNKIWDGTAIGLGAGIRLNFSFFILRFDFAAPFKDPGKADPNLFKLYWDRTNLNFGIGYPF